MSVPDGTPANVEVTSISSKEARAIAEAEHYMHHRLDIPR